MEAFSPRTKKNQVIIVAALSAILVVFMLVVLNRNNSESIPSNTSTTYLNVVTSLDEIKKLQKKTDEVTIIGGWLRGTKVLDCLELDNQEWITVD